MQTFNPQLKLALIILVILLPTIVLYLLPPIPQPLEYHQFADQRKFLGIDHFWNVISNIAFLIVGAWGVLAIFYTKEARLTSQFEKFTYTLFFISIVLIGFGSIYYHSLPNNQRLFWDRLSMSMAFISFFVITVYERISEKWAIYSVIPLLLLGIFSVIYWEYTELINKGDLRLTYAWMSGHPFKHIFSAIAAYFIARYIAKRHPI